MPEETLKQLVWVGSTKRDLLALPPEIRKAFGFALYDAQRGEKHPHAKPLKRFRGAGVLEIVENLDGETYRTVYTVRLEHAVYVLHVFEKKSKSGISTPQADINMIKWRLKEAEVIDKGWGHE